MTITEMSTLFDVLQDKYGSPAFLDSEKELFLNRAQIQYVNDLLPDNDGGIVNIEKNQDTFYNIEPLVFDLGYLNMSSVGEVLKSAVTTKLQAVSTGATLWRELSIGWTVGSDKKPVKFTRKNDWYEFQKNFFKRPKLTSPRYHKNATSYVFEPIHPGAKLYFTVLKYPKPMSISTPTSCELPDNTHDDILVRALILAGVASRDELLVSLTDAKNKIK